MRTGISRLRKQVHRVLPQLLIPWGSLPAQTTTLPRFELVDAGKRRALQAVWRPSPGNRGNSWSESVRLALRRDGVDKLADHGVLAGADQI